ncbi:MAG TPA: helicase-related protein [Gemmataceae bacterium]|nr:helicase-related protein [Gemmataceae bacterium]
MLARIGRFAGRDVQRVGLSATVGNPDEMLDWLSSGSARDRQVVRPEPTPGNRPEVQLDYVGSLPNAAKVIRLLHRGEKRLVFCDSRSRVEQLAQLLRQDGTDTFVSHSSLGLDERRSAERAFAQRQNCVIVATSSLELGLDVGDLDRVIQIDAPPAVSSFLQRMGRTGRRAGTTPNCLFLATTDEGLLRAAALLDLWQAGFVEPVVAPPQPFHILAQQLMALVLQERGVGRSEWFDWVATVPGYAEMDTEAVSDLVEFMLRSGILWSDNGVLFFAPEGEAKYGRKNFLELLSVFTSPPLFRGVSWASHRRRSSRRMAWLPTSPVVVRWGCHHRLFGTVPMPNRVALAAASLAVATPEPADNPSEQARAAVAASGRNLWSFERFKRRFAISRSASARFPRRDYMAPGDRRRHGGYTIAR